MAAQVTVAKDLGRILDRNYNDGTLKRRQYEELMILRCADKMIDVLTAVCKDTEGTIKKMEIQQMMGCLQINSISTWLQIIKGSSLCIGSEKVTRACDEFLKAKELWDLTNMSPFATRCEEALLNLRREFNHVKSVFQEIIELEWEIVRLTTPIRQKSPDNITESSDSWSFSL